MNTFLRGGVSFFDDQKSQTSHKPIERFVPKEVTIPLSQHLGEPARPLVARKQKVTRGDCIGEVAPGGAPIHASVTGTVKRVALQPHPLLVESLAIVIETDPNAAETVWEEVPGWMDLPKEKMLEQIAAAGIVGLGGAQFPTYRKLRLPEGVKVDTLILNGAECEPYLTSDHRLLLEMPVEVLQGANLIAKILGVSKILIGIEENKKDAADVLRIAIAKLCMTPKIVAASLPHPTSPYKGEEFPLLYKEGLGEVDRHAKIFKPLYAHPVSSPMVVLCQTRYPQGSEKQLIEALTGRVVPPGKLPMHVGVMVQNVATAVACYQAIRYRKPLLDRILTVSGKGILEPKNVSVPIGTLVSDIVAFCGGIHQRTNKVIVGGPMMGRALGRLDVPVIKGTGGLLFLRAEEVRKEIYGPCISCGRCLEACPLGLEPNQISIYTEAGRALETESFGTKECFECGSCAYVCPAARPLVQFIQIAKKSFQTGSQLGLARPGQIYV